MITNHSIEADCPAEVAFSLCLDVQRWPELFPPCLHAEVIEETQTEQRIALSAKANGQVMSWQSLRQVDRPNMRISFMQSRPSPLVDFMRGEWKFAPTETGCSISLGHEFAIKSQVKGLVPGVNTPEDASAFMLKTVDENSHRELSAYRTELERLSWKHEFSESLVIAHSKTAIYKLLRDAASWPWLLPHCDAIEMTYEDPQHQEFQMTVQVGDKTELIRSVRLLLSDCIEYFQPAPPPALREHRGRWSLRETAGGVEVTSWHSVVLAPAFWADSSRADAKHKVEAAINRNSLGTMQAIAEKLGGGRHVHA